MRRGAAVLLLAVLAVASASWMGGCPAEFAAAPQPPPVKLYQGEAQAALGPNQTSASVLVNATPGAAGQIVVNPTFTGVLDPWFFHEFLPNPRITWGYNSTGGYAYVSGNMPRSLFPTPIPQASNGFLQQVYIPSTELVYGTVDLAYTMSTLEFRAVVVGVVVYDTNYNLVASQEILSIGPPQSTPAWNTYEYNLSGLIPAPGTYYVGVEIDWFYGTRSSYTATVYVDNFYLYVGGAGGNDTFTVGNALQIVNLDAGTAWMAKLRVESYAANGTVDWVNVTLTDASGNTATPEISYSAGALLSAETGTMPLAASGNFGDTLYVQVRGRLPNPGDTLTLNMTLVLDNGAGTILEYPVSLTVARP